MDQKAIRLTRLFYRKSLLSKILTNKEEDLVKCLKSLNLKTAVCLLHNAWEKVPSTTVQKYWKKIFPTNNNNALDLEDTSEDSIPLNILRDRIR
jgi:hypothetical protein